MAVVDSDVESLMREICPEEDIGVWLIVLGGYIRMHSIQRNLLEEDVVKGTDVPLEDLYAMEDGDRCLEASQLLEIIEKFGYHDLRAFIEDAYLAIRRQS